MVFIYLAVCYLIGSVPVAWLVGELFGKVDMREQGSGNVGVMNVAISVSRWAALLVFLAEAVKGFLVVYLARRWELSDVLTGLAVVIAVAGTHWSIWIRGAGGRGNTLGVAALLALSWQAVIISLAVWLAARVITRNSFWATEAWIVSLPFALGLATMSWAFAATGAALSLLYLVIHRAKTDDHTMLKENWPSLWAFLTAPRRKR
jgi:glycerol-3-phosphate acyltransferase PlsY